MCDEDLKKRIEKLENSLGILEDVHATHENGRAYTPPHFVPNQTTTYPDDPYGPDELTEIKPLLWPEHEVLPFHCEYPVTGKPIVTPEPGLKP